MTNVEIVEKFYDAFKTGDFVTMNSCYASDIVFSDPVYGLLYNDEVRAMWQMSINHIRNFELAYDNITEVDDEYITCTWQMVYTDQESQRRIIKQATAFMRIAEGKIIEHSDGFRLSTWIAQVLGLRGKLFGWTNFLKRRVQKRARRELESFMQAI